VAAEFRGGAGGGGAARWCVTAVWHYGSYLRISEMLLAIRIAAVSGFAALVLISRPSFSGCSPTPEPTPVIDARILAEAHGMGFVTNTANQLMVLNLVRYKDGYPAFLIAATWAPPEDDSFLRWESYLKMDEHSPMIPVFMNGRDFDLDFSPSGKSAFVNFTIGAGEGDAFIFDISKISAGNIDSSGIGPLPAFKVRFLGLKGESAIFLSSICRRQHLTLERCVHARYEALSWIDDVHVKTHLFENFCGRGDSRMEWHAILNVDKKWLEDVKDVKP
jgi:hypothetical protein